MRKIEKTFLPSLFPSWKKSRIVGFNYRTLPEMPAEGVFFGLNVVALVVLIWLLRSLRKPT